MPADSLRLKRHLYRLLRPHAAYLTLGIVAVILGGLASLAEPWPLKIVLDHVLKAKPLPGWLRPVTFWIGNGDRLSVLRVAVFGLMAIVCIGAASAYLEKYMTINIGQRVGLDLRQSLYGHIHRLSLAYHDTNRTGDLISRLTADIDAIESFIGSGLLSGLVNSLTLAGMAALMLWVNPRFTLVALSVAPVLLTVVFRYTRSIKKASREVRKREAEMVSVMQEVLNSIRLVKAYVCEEFEQDRLTEENLKTLEIGRRARNLKVRLSPLVDLIVSAGVCMILWFGGKMALQGTLSSGTLVLFIFYLGRMYKPMRDLSKMTDAYAKAAIGYERILEVMEADCEIKESAHARLAPRFRGRIEFGNVSFAYQPNRPVLQNVSFTVEPGQTAALVGATGSGKTTIINLIPRFYDPDAGTVMIDGTDVRLFGQKSLRKQISLVLQDTLLFRGPVWYNIAYGKPNASRAEILRAAALANAAEFIEAMPQGYNTVIGERGVTLSGGQRQRIAIARAIIRDTPILILDEVTGLDAASEALVFDALERLMKGRTSIVIAHRLTTIRSADVIFVVKEGEIAERGSHEELLQKKGLYSHLYELNIRAEDAARTYGVSLDTVVPEKKGGRHYDYVDC